MYLSLTDGECKNDAKYRLEELYIKHPYTSQLNL